MNPYQNAMQNIQQMQAQHQMNPTGMTPQQVASIVMPQQSAPNPTGMNMSQINQGVMGLPNPTGMNPTQIANTVAPPSRNFGPSGSSGMDPMQIMQAIYSADPSVFDAPDAPDPSIFNNAGNVLTAKPSGQQQSMTGSLMNMINILGK